MSSSPRLDDQILATLHDVMGDDFSLLMDTYMNDSEARIRSLADNIAQQDADMLRRTAHSFKGSSCNIGALRLGDYCGVMETLALAGDPAPWPQQLVKIKEEYAEVIKLLQQ